MNNIIKQLKKTAKNTRLSAVEKSEMKNVLHQYVKAHPVDHSLSSATPSPFFMSKLRNKKTILGLIAGSLLVGSSVSFAAEAAVPGDILYPIKVNLNEGVRKAVAITLEAKAALDVTLIERRLVEVEKLAVQPSVSAEIREQAAENLKRYTHEAEERLETVENDNDGDEATHIIAMTNLSIVLNNHERILSEIHSDIVKDSATSTKNSFAKTNIIFATTTADIHTEHSNNEESVKIVLDNVRESIKEIKVKSEELKKKHSKSLEATSTASVANESVKREESNQEKKDVVPVVVHTQIAIPAGIHPDEHQAVIENHYEAPVSATSTMTTEAREQKTSEVKTDSNKSNTETEERHKREEAHTETIRSATSTSEHD